MLKNNGKNTEDIKNEEDGMVKVTSFASFAIVHSDSRG